MSKVLNSLKNFKGVQGPVVTIVMDGVGLAPDTGLRLEHPMCSGSRQAGPMFDQVMWYYQTSLEAEQKNGKKICGTDCSWSIVRRCKGMRR